MTTFKDGISNDENISVQSTQHKFDLDIDSASETSSSADLNRIQQPLIKGSFLNIKSFSSTF